MGYYINLSSIGIDSYKTKLESSELLPSRMILKDQIEERFHYFKSIGITNVLQLQQMLKKKDKMVELSNLSLFTADYLAILLREINSMHPKPNKIKEFDGLSSDTVYKLEKIGVKDTLRLFDAVLTPESRMELANTVGIAESEIMVLTKLTDLSRIKWVGATFAKVLFESGFDTVEKVSKANYLELHKRISQLNKEHKLFKGNIGLNDMKLCVNAAREVTLDIEY
jgi:hypothetical protein